MLSTMISASSLGAPAATPPTFAQDYYVGVQSALAINQGGYSIENGVCCSKEHASQCKIQGINQGADTYEQGTKARTRSDSAHGSVVNWWGDVKKQMAIVPGSAVNSTHKFACAAYCPLDGEYSPSLLIGDGQTGFFDTPKDKGPASITQPASIGNATKVCEHWKWTETILKIIPMSTTDFYVDMSVTPPAPFFQSQVIKPFNKEIGVENASYLDYTPKDVSEYFDIDPDSVAKCALSDSCNPPPSPAGPGFDADPELLMRALAPHVAALNALLPPETVYAAALKAKASGKLEAEAVAAPSAPRDPLPPQPNITFVGDFTAHEEVINMIAQGASYVGGDPCCMSNSPAPQCQVQLQHQAGMRYLDVTNQRTRFEDAVADQIIVDDYTALKSMEVKLNTTTGKETCVEYCPIDPDDHLEPLDPFDPFDKTTDLGKTTFEGKSVEHYSWSDVILKIIKMSTTDFYADISNPKAAVPVYLHQDLTPFGRKPPIGGLNQSWTGFKPGTPDKKKFDIAGVATCKQASNCQSSSKQAHRFALRQMHTAARYMPLDA